MMGAEWRIPITTRLLDRSERTESGCLVWTGSKSPHGYGRLGYQGQRTVNAHRVAYMEWVGPIPEGAQIDHLCHTLDEACTAGRECPHRACIEPTHLEVVLPGENTQRGRSFAPDNGRKTHCPSGHDYDDANTIHYKGRRYCRTCMYKHNRESKARKRAAA